MAAAASEAAAAKRSARHGDAELQLLAALGLAREAVAVDRAAAARVGRAAVLLVGSEPEGDVLARAAGGQLQDGRRGRLLVGNGRRT